MLKFIVVLLEFDLLCGCMRANFMRLIPIGKIVVVSPNNYRYRCFSE